MARINYRIIGTAIIGTAIIGQCDSVKDCRSEILSSYGPAKFEWWSDDGKRSGNARVKNSR